MQALNATGCRMQKINILPINQSFNCRKLFEYAQVTQAMHKYGPAWPLFYVRFTGKRLNH